MVQFFGLQVAEMTQKMGEKLSSGQGMHQSTMGGDRDAADLQPESLSFSEFLIFARKVREEMFMRYRTFRPPSRNKSRVSKRRTSSSLTENQPITERELRRILTDRGYTPLQKVLDEILQEVSSNFRANPDGTTELDSDEFYD